MWYTDNKFQIEVRDCDATLMRLWHLHLDETSPDRDAPLDAEIAPLLAGTPSWSNLENWCEDIWARESWGIRKDESNESPLSAVIAAAHDVVLQHFDQPWERCLHALRNLRFAVERLDRRWMNT